MSFHEMNRGHKKASHPPLPRLGPSSKIDCFRTECQVTKEKIVALKEFVARQRKLSRKGKPAMTNACKDQSEKQLIALERMMRGWPGEPLDRRGIVRILNATGSKPPIFWIFNVRHEPENFANALGPDQPLIYGRSLHLILGPDEDRDSALIGLANYFLRWLAPRMTVTRHFLGANCQGARCLLMLTQRLMAKDIRVSGVCLISALPDIEVGVPALLIYGSRDPHHDPFFHDAVSAQKQASRCFATVRRQLVDAEHGQYGRVETVETVVARVQDFLASLNARAAFSA
ncbi:hypothetical protein ACN2XU_09100 [Primorskyibacter sp. 2E107]|uniref:hypothetical protein n=1 Tax=Primorskyibacter sp. 2E107 TaxID=3403458 RepID=UPI003AF8F427